MRVLNPTIENTISIILRSYSDNGKYKLLITNENNGDLLTVDFSESTSTIECNNNNLNVTIPINYTEGDMCSYVVTNRDSDENIILHRGKLFFTNQVPQNYSINE